MCDLISRKRIMDEAKRLSGPMTGDGWDNWGVYALIERQPSVPAVPLDKVCELIAEANYVVPCRICEYCDTGDCEIFPCPSTAEGWRNALTKWMEGLDGSEIMVQKT